MKISPSETRGLLIVVSIMLAVWALVKELPPGGTPAVGIGTAVAMSVIITAAIRSKPKPPNQSDGTP